MHLPWITLVVLTLLIGILDPTFLTPHSLLELASDIAALFIMAMGITFVVYIGGIDLSAQSIANMTTVVVTLLLPRFGFGAALISVALGAGFGALSGLILTRAKIPSFITTLAIGGVALSVGQYVSGQRALYMNADDRSASLGWMVGNTFGIPGELFVAGGLFLVALFIERRTTIGRVLKAIGNGEAGTIASGINVERYKIFAFAISGLLAAAAGVLLATRLSGGSPQIANQFLLPAIVAVLVGGTPLTGGVGGVLNTLIGALIVAVIRTSMVYLAVPASAQQIFFGVVLIVAIALTIDRRKVKLVK